MFCEIDELGYFISDAPLASEESALVVPHNATDGTKPDGMRKAKWTGASWIDEEAAQLDVDLKAEKNRAIEKAIDTHILKIAQAKGYNSTESCLSYLGDNNTTWANEAQAFKNWRSQCWEYVIAEQAKIDTGTRTLPTPQEAIAELPAMTWP